MENARFHCLSLSRLNEYLVGKKRLSIYPLDVGMEHAIRQIVDLAMETFEKNYLVVPALPSSFTLDVVPKAFEYDLKKLLVELLKDSCLSVEDIKVTVSKGNKKMNIFLR